MKMTDLASPSEDQDDPLSDAEMEAFGLFLYEALTIPPPWTGAPPAEAFASSGKEAADRDLKGGLSQELLLRLRQKQ